MIQNKKEATNKEQIVPINIKILKNNSLLPSGRVDKKSSVDILKETNKDSELEGNIIYVSELYIL